MTSHHELLARWSDRIKIPDDPNACWIWTGQVNNWGYAVAVGPVPQQKVAVHRVVYEFFKGPIEGGRQVDHTCRVRNCLNPSHLQTVTPSRNVALEKLRNTTCPHGHPYDDAIINHFGHRVCRECNRINSRRGYVLRKYGIALTFDEAAEQIGRRKR